MTLLPLILILLAARLLQVSLIRYHRREKTLESYSKRYAVNQQDEKEGKIRMNSRQAGHRGVRDAQRIFLNLGAWEMPFVTQKSLEFALFRTYGIPTISKILAATGQFVEQGKSTRRYVDTAVAVASFFTYPLPLLDLNDNDVPPKEEEEWYEANDPRSAIAIARVNWLHQRAKSLHEPQSTISNDDLLYTLSTFILQPPIWYEKAGYRTASPLEKEALFTLFYHIGRCMRIDSIPSTLAELETWSLNYEEKNMVFSENNKKVADETVRMLLYNVPSFAHGFAQKVVVSLMDDRLRIAMGYSKPPLWLYKFSNLTLSMIGIFQRYLLLPRSEGKTLAPIGKQGLCKGVKIDPMQSLGVCPASGVRADSGKTCPVGGDGEKKGSSNKQNEKEKEKPRLTPNWFDNDPHYSRAASKFTPLWIYEHLFVKVENRRGAKKWRPSSLEKNLPTEPIQGLDCGYRVEELGPKGLEQVGVKEVYDEAKRLNGGRELEGVWGMENPRKK